MKSLPNRRCPACQEAGRDNGSDAGHLFLSEKGDNWICSRVEYHKDKQYFISRHNPETGGPVCYDNVSSETKPKAPESEGFGDATGFDFSSAPPSNKVDPVKFRGIPPDILKKYGVKHEVDSDGKTIKVFYPMYQDGKQTDWKVRDVANKKFHAERI